MAIPIDAGSFPDFSAFRITSSDDGTTLSVVGEVDASTDAEFEAALAQALRSKAPVEVDFRSCQYLGASSIASMLRLQGIAGRRLRLIAPGDGIVARVINVAGLESAFDMRVDADRAAEVP